MSAFSDFCADYFKKYFELHPTDAIYYGIEGYDHLLNDYSDEAYRAEKAFVEESLGKLRRISAQGLDQDEAIDHALLEGRLTIQQYEYKKEDYRLKWPDTYLPTDAIYILTVRAISDFAGNLLSRLGRTPRRSVPRRIDGARCRARRHRGTRGARDRPPASAARRRDRRSRPADA